MVGQPSVLNVALGRTVGRWNQLSCIAISGGAFGLIPRGEALGAVRSVHGREGFSHPPGAFGAKQLATAFLGPVWAVRLGQLLLDQLQDELALLGRRQASKLCPLVLSQPINPLLQLGRQSLAERPVLQTTSIARGTSLVVRSLAEDVDRLC